MTRLRLHTFKSVYWRGSSLAGWKCLDLPFGVWSLVEPTHVTSLLIEKTRGILLTLLLSLVLSFAGVIPIFDFSISAYMAHSSPRKCDFSMRSIVWSMVRDRLSWSNTMSQTRITLKEIHWADVRRKQVIVRQYMLSRNHFTLTVHSSFDPILIS